jgi:hemerythrin-like domain-containing protein
MAQKATLEPDFQVFRAMIYYIDAFPERMHHPKEEGLLARLDERCAQARPLIEKLRAEHVRGAAMVRDLERTLLAYEQAWPLGGDRAAVDVSRYAQFHWNHMRCEERELLPLAEAHLRPEDWAQIDAAFTANDDPIADLRDQDFRQLFQRIVSLAPAPVGVGASWPTVD